MSSSSTNRYVPLQHAAERYGISEESLQQRIEADEIAWGRLPDGTLLVAEDEIDPSLKIKREDFEHLRGQTLSESEASCKYDISVANFSNWAKAGHIQVVERGWKVLLDEADVAYCAAVYKAKAKIYPNCIGGFKLFDEDGNPYQIKYPELAARRRKGINTREKNPQYASHES